MPDNLQTVVANLSTVDKSDLLTVRSLPEEPQPEQPLPEQPLPRPAPAPASAYEDLVFSLASATDTKLESEEVGGISHIPGKAFKTPSYSGTRVLKYGILKESFNYECAFFS